MATSAEANDDRHAQQHGTSHFHPYLVAAFAVTSLYVANINQTRFVDVLLPLLTLVMLAALCVRLMRLCFSSRIRAAIGATYAITITLAYARGYDFAQSFIDYDLPRRYALLAYLAALVLGLFIVGRARFNEPRVNRVLNVFSCMLVLVSIVSIMMAMTNRYYGPNLRLVPERTSTEESIVLKRPTVARDIYYLVFDRYSNDQVLREQFDFDNTPFLNQLSQRGFHCVSDSWANYPSTVMSMSSALNLDYHEDVIRTEHFYAKRVHNHLLGRLLKKQGYRYYHFGNWYSPLRHNKNADYNLRVSRLPSEFADLLYKQTPVGHADKADLMCTRGDPMVPLMKFDAIARMASDEGPKFVYAHFLLPHPPYVFDRDGTLLDKRMTRSRTKTKNYVNQLIYTNQRIIELIDVIQRAGETPPVIILQSDEGPELYDADKKKDWASKCRKRAGILSALCLPRVDGRQAIPPTLSPVNTFRLVLNAYFGADLELRDDRCYFWRPTETPFHPTNQRFVDVTAVVRHSSH